jgi:hypothetical protein
LTKEKYKAYLIVTEVAQWHAMVQAIFLVRERDSQEHSRQIGGRSGSDFEQLSVENSISDTYGEIQLAADRMRVTADTTTLNDRDRAAVKTNEDIHFVVEHDAEVSPEARGIDERLRQNKTSLG